MWSVVIGSALSTFHLLMTIQVSPPFKYTLHRILFTQEFRVSIAEFLCTVVWMVAWPIDEHLIVWLILTVTFDMACDLSSYNHVGFFKSNITYPLKMLFKSPMGQQQTCHDWTIYLIWAILYKNIERHIAHTIVSWPSDKQWQMRHTFELIMIIG